MVKCYVLLVIAALVAVPHAHPLEPELDKGEEPSDLEDNKGELDKGEEPSDLEDNKGELLDRYRRVTCDLLGFQSAWFSPGDSACAAHCLTKRYKGGHCVNGVCTCRR